MENLRSLLITYAYNITGCVDVAKDIVQDVYVKFLDIPRHEVLNQDAYLKRMVINHAINYKNKHRRIIKSYPGEWLPEPIATETADGIVNQKDILSYSIMVLLEKLNPRQRAVFILKEAFDYEHGEIAEILSITEENSRQLLTRAKKQLTINSGWRVKYINEPILQRYMQVIQQADTKRLQELLNEDIVVISDGGGKVSSGVNPIVGRKDVTAMLSGIYRKFYHGKQMEMGYVNHLPALYFYTDGILRTCKIFSVVNNTIERVFILRNPDKLKFLQKAKETVTQV